MVVGGHLFVLGVLHDLQTPEEHGHEDKGNDHSDPQPDEADFIVSPTFV
jgi:hypothetical protein